MKALLVYIGLFGICLSSNSQDSLLFYLETTAKNNPVILQRYYEYQAALQKVPQVGSFPDPELSMGVFLSPMELANGNQLADIRLMQMFPWFGVLRNAKDEKSLMAKAKFESLRDTKLLIFYDVQRTWYELYKVKQKILISERNIGILHTIERLALVRFKSTPAVDGNSLPFNGNASTGNDQNSNSGSSDMNSMRENSLNNQSESMLSNSMGSSSSGSGLTELYRIQMNINETDNNIFLLKNQQNTITARFNSYMNRPLQTPVSLPDTLTQDTLTISLTDIPEKLLGNNPMLGMLKYEQKSIEAFKKMGKGMGYPMVGLGANYSLINKSTMSTSSMNGSDMIMPMVTVTLPIYRKKFKAIQSEADLMITANKQGYIATVNSLQTEYYEALQLYQDSQRLMKLYENQNLLTKKTLNIMIRNFSVSGSGLADILQIRQQMLDYEFNQIEALVDYNISIAWLKRLMADSQIQ